MKYKMLSYILLLALTPFSIIGMESLSADQLEQKLDQLQTDHQTLSTIVQQSPQIQANKKIRDNPTLVMKYFPKWQIQNPQGTLAQYYLFLNEQAALADALPRYRNQEKRLAKEIGMLNLEISRRKARPEQKELVLKPQKSKKPSRI